MERPFPKIILIIGMFSGRKEKSNQQPCGKPRGKRYAYFSTFMNFFGKRLNNALLEDVGSFGSTVFSLILVLVFYAFDANLAFLLLTGIVVGSLLGYFLKLIVRTKRPDHDVQTQSGTFFERWDESTFPSIHALRITTMAGLLIRRFGYWIDLLLIMVAIGVVISRVITRRHRMIDVLTGCLLGVLTSLILIMFWEN